MNHMDFLTPKAMVVAAIISVASASVNTGMFTWVNGNVTEQSVIIQENAKSIVKHTEQIEQLKEGQEDVKKYTKYLYDQELKRQGKESVNDSRTETTPVQ